MEIGVFFEFQLGVSAMLASLQTLSPIALSLLLGVRRTKENSFHGLEHIVLMHVKVHPSEWNNNVLIDRLIVMRIISKHCWPIC
jgi:hypothetical protein